MPWCLSARGATLAEMPLGLSVSLTSRCAKCHRPRNIELSREAKGGRVLPLASEDDGGVTYAAQTGEACRCGSNKLIIRLWRLRSGSGG